MLTRGKSINVFWMDGKANGRIKCTLANWTGVAYRIPRTELDKCKGRADLSQSGVYFLFGSSDDHDDNVVYVGQAGVRKSGEGIFCRLLEHKRSQNKDYWIEAIVFTTSNNSFGPTEISYLEHRFCSMAVLANRYMIKNGNEPTAGHITEEKESELEEFIDYAKVIMGTLGHNLFEPILQEPKPITEVDHSNDDSPLLYMNRTTKKSKTIIKATGKQPSEGFVLFSGSQIETIDSDTITESLKQRRKKANIDANGILQEDLLFSSPSASAMFAIGSSANGLTEWKTADGKTLKDLESE